MRLWWKCAKCSHLQYVSYVFFTEFYISVKYLKAIADSHQVVEFYTSNCRISAYLDLVIVPLLEIWHIRLLRYIIWLEEFIRNKKNPLKIGINRAIRFPASSHVFNTRKQIVSFRSFTRNGCHKSTVSLFNKVYIWIKSLIYK